MAECPYHTKYRLRIMKKQLLNLWTIAMLSIATVFSSCSNDDVVTPPAPTPEPAKATTYTVMLYGCGGGNLDNYLDYNLSQLDGAGKQARINFTGLVKFSKSRQSEASTSGTRLYTMTEDGLKNEKKYEAGFRMDNPENLANFIKETKEKMPADKYILIFWNHGGEFGIDEKLVQSSYPEGGNSRAVLFDDNIGEIGLSTFEIEKGIKDSDTKFDLLYLDLCNMGMAEVYYQLKDCAHYIMGATQPTPGLGGNYTQLVSDLQEKDSLEDAIKAYVPKCVQNWATNEAGRADLECYDMTYMDELTNHVKNAVAQLTKDRNESVNVPEDFDDYDPRQQAKMKWYNAQDSLPFVVDGSGISADMSSTFTRLAGALNDGKLSSYATLIEKTIEKMTVANSHISLPSWMQRMSMGITWPTTAFNQFINTDNNSQNVYAAALDNSSFLQATGWREYLKSCKFPSIFSVRSAYSANNDFYYEGEQSPITYEWEASVVPVPESLMEDENIKQLIETINEIYRQHLDQDTYILRHGRGIVEDMHNMIQYNYLYELENNNINKIKITASLKEGQDIDPADPDADKYPATVTQKFDLEE